MTAAPLAPCGIAVDVAECDCKAYEIAIGQMDALVEAELEREERERGA
ncbi:MAG TPA: hypothetical protein VN579_07465 [Bryobacteraceae bacterium]|nr:hypothetical protein [Bryobacteraceae bacterium]